jgi:hypothetical protein
MIGKLLHKLNKSITLRILSIIVVGAIVSFILNFILISIGYFSMGMGEQIIYDVSCFGLPIYQIARSGDSLIGNAIGANMSIIGVIISFAMVTITEIAIAIHHWHKKKRDVKRQK